MKAILIREPGGTDQLYIGEVPDLAAKADQLLIKVHATALNRADLLQRRGLYPPPKGESEIMGLEMAGEVVAVGGQCTGFSLGDRVCGLLPGGGYAEYVTLPYQMAMKIPERLSYEQAAAIPEVFLTAYLNLFQLGELTTGETVVIHAGASGVGTAAIQLVREAGATSIVTASTNEKLEMCKSLGAGSVLSYLDGPFAPKVLDITKGKGANIILDFIGAPYWEQNIQCLGYDGRLLIIGTMGGANVQNVNLGELLRKRVKVIGTALRSRSVDSKIDLTQKFMLFAWERFGDGRLVPVVDRVFSFADVAEAHRYMEENKNIGKIVLRL
ncbi:NAD(P)H-quinone oxidoreductase [Fodinisporobacter ferrooxydans]|uniref:NAD(P)H-quinone oxidoreductase n=1 Tax=Fodinisporobacter ferrooxydans TaxID=2901836 RepID=A0ABY4CJE5_9BACL|nr:NAD(P)H-quinone oxidoreductase [Alicyclobacillaceae bacterium MYW30-H2]